jgi:hypothetical protein
MTTISPPDSVALHEFLTRTPSHFETVLHYVRDLLGVVVGAAISWIGQVWLARREERRFVVQQWWQYSYAAYQSVAASLAQQITLVTFFGNKIRLDAVALDQATAIGSRLNEISKTFADTMNQGTLLLSQSAQECVRATLDRAGALEATGADREAALAMVKAYLAIMHDGMKQFAEIARHDLKAPLHNRRHDG